jgi:hypothetical protein
MRVAPGRFDDSPGPAAPTIPYRIRPSHIGLGWSGASPSCLGFSTRAGPLNAMRKVQHLS